MVCMYMTCMCRYVYTNVQVLRVAIVINTRGFLARLCSQEHIVVVIISCCLVVSQQALLLIIDVVVLGPDTVYRGRSICVFCQVMVVGHSQNWHDGDGVK